MERDGASDLLRRVSQEGYAVVAPESVAVRVREDPWRFASELLGMPVSMVERQPIQAVSHGRSIASTSGAAPLHTDSQTLWGVPATYQILVCLSPAASGGESTLVDGWKVIQRASLQGEYALARLFREIRRIPFYFGELSLPTVSEIRQHVFFTHSPAPPKDPMAHWVRGLVDAEQPTRVLLKAGEVLVSSNHRMLHGREAFRDSLETRRELTRLLVWPVSPAAVDPGVAHWVLRFSVAKAALGEVEPRAEELTLHRARLILEWLRGGAVGAISHREGIPEAELYRMRDAFLAGGHQGLLGNR